MFKSAHAAILFCMTLCVTAPIIYAEDNNDIKYYIVGHGIIVKHEPTVKNNPPCPEKCSIPSTKPNTLG